MCCPSSATRLQQHRNEKYLSGEFCFSKLVMAANPARPFKLIPPFRFSIVELDVYRGAYPTLKNFPFLKTLALKTIISLTPVCACPKIFSFLVESLSIHLQERPIPDLEDFCFCEGVELRHYMGNPPTARTCTALASNRPPPRPLHCID
jgi:hypothetical protein